VATAQMNAMVRQLRRAVLLKDGAGRSDAQLLCAFIEQKDDAAFEALVRRHGPMVWGVCRRVGGNHHDADDAFQATFLVLARKARSINPRERLPNWLHGVAYRTAMKARSIAAKRSLRERQMADLPERAAAEPGQCHDLRSLLDRELCALPEKYRLPILLCHLEGRTIKDVALQLGWPQGTVAGRLARARILLARRLARRGLMIASTSLAAALAQNTASANVPAAAMSSAAKYAILMAAGHALGAAVPATVATLTQGVTMSMTLTKLKTFAALVVLGAAALGGGLALQYSRAAANASDGPVAVDPPRPMAEQQGPPVDQSLDQQKLHGVWTFTRDGNVQGAFVFGPGKSVRRLMEDRVPGADDEGTYVVDWSTRPYHLEVKLGKHLFRLIMDFTEDGNLRIESDLHDLSRTPRAFSEQATLLTKTDKYAPGTKDATDAATEALAVANFYKRTGHFGSAHFYYQIVRARYPNTEQARAAERALEELKKSRTRLPDGSDAWIVPERPGQRQPPPSPVDAPPPMANRNPSGFSQDLRELKELLDSLERRLNGLADKGSALQPPADRNVPAVAPEIEQLRRQMQELQRRLALIEAASKK
jgi:RNA polymerase sigma factor (sigma-70 family)